METTYKIIASLIFTLAGCGGSTIGGNDVPNDLHCEEDEAITFVQIGEPPYELGCVLLDTIRETG